MSYLYQVGSYLLAGGTGILAAKAIGTSTANGYIFPVVNLAIYAFLDRVTPDFSPIPAIKSVVLQMIGVLIGVYATRYLYYSKGIQWKQALVSHAASVAMAFALVYFFKPDQISSHLAMLKDYLYFTIDPT